MTMWKDSKNSLLTKSFFLVPKVQELAHSGIRPGTHELYEKRKALLGTHRLYEKRKASHNQGGNQAPFGIELEPEWEVLPHFKIYGGVLKRFYLDINPKPLHCHTSYYI
jgi:hypothetical protein